MPIFLLDDSMRFPDPELADPSGVIAIGGDLSVERLLRGYSVGIFPWFNPGDPIIWHAPPDRMVLEPEQLYVGRSLRKAIKRAPYEIKYDTAFAEVITACADVPRPMQEGTWITDDMLNAYMALHHAGYAHSAEAWQGERLVGGLYGVTLGGVFFGESMFALAPDASKITFATLVPQLAAFGFKLIDCQVHTDHLARFGAQEWPRRRFSEALQRALLLQPSQDWPVGDPPVS
ncbi:MAG: leucyl/phenylalanyl-tRNA--protein transferase [Bradymonadia bacterium]